MLLIQSSLLEVEILPEVGEVGQIRDRESGYELLITPQKPYRTIPEDGNWTEYDTSGMDDCFPNIAAGPYPFEPMGRHYSYPILVTGHTEFGMSARPAPPGYIGTQGSDPAVSRSQIDSLHRCDYARAVLPR